MISATVTRMPRAGRVLSLRASPVVEGVGVPVERGPVDPVEPVARLVVAGVERRIGLAAPGAGLFGRLALLGSGEDAAHRDSGREERGVVRAPVEVGALRRDTRGRQ